MGERLWLVGGGIPEAPARHGVSYQDPSAHPPTHPLLAYTRSKRFRARWMAKKLVQLSASLGLMLFVTEQYIQPTIDNSLRPMREMVGGGGAGTREEWDVQRLLMEQKRPAAHAV